MEREIEKDKERNSTKSTSAHNLGSQNLSWFKFNTFHMWKKRLSNHTNSVNNLTELFNLCTFSLALNSKLTERGGYKQILSTN